jgi:TorA maturation chaperone TorD
MNAFRPIEPHLRAFEILGQVSRSRSLTYRHLALSFSSPDEGLFGLVHQGQMARELKLATAWLGEDQAKLLRPIAQLEYSAMALSGLQRSYSQYFGQSLDRVSPRESSYRWKDTGYLTQASHDLCRSLQHEYSLYDVRCPGGLEDHVAVELEFLAYLCDREASLWSAAAAKSARELRSHQRAFVDDHLGRWLPEFCRRLRECAAQSFYGHMAELCDGWLSLDHGSGYAPLAD